MIHWHRANSEASQLQWVVAFEHLTLLEAAVSHCTAGCHLSRPGARQFFGCFLELGPLCPKRPKVFHGFPHHFDDQMINLGWFEGVIWGTTISGNPRSVWPMCQRPKSGWTALSTGPSMVWTRWVTGTQTIPKCGELYHLQCGLVMFSRACHNRNEYLWSSQHFARWPWIPCGRPASGMDMGSPHRPSSNSPQTILASPAAQRPTEWCELSCTMVPGFTGALGQFRACCEGREKTWQTWQWCTQNVESVWNGWFSKPPP